jgi:hypothetical protein
MAKAYVGTACLEQTGCDLLGVVEDGMTGRKGSESVEPLEGRLGAVCTAKASGINRNAVKSGCACEWGGWGRLSVDGPGQKNPDRSEGPWGRAAEAVRTEVFQRATSTAQNGDQTREAGSTKDEGKLIDARAASHGKALSDQPALKPYWGKPAVRNFREGNGNVGIMRSPLRAIALPDQSHGLHFFPFLGEEVMPWKKYPLKPGR